MASGTSYPGSLDSFANKAAGDNLTIGNVNTIFSAIEALEGGPIRPTKATAALPVYSFQGDTDTGIDSLAANQIDLITAGVARASIIGGTLQAAAGGKIKSDQFKPIAVEDTEATTTSTSAVDVISKSGLSIATTSLILITVNVRKTTGAVGASKVGLKLNSTVVRAPVDVTNNSTNAAENGLAIFIVGPQNSSYAKAGFLIGIAEAAFVHQQFTAMPNATITDIAIQGQVDVGITGGYDDMRVYEFSGS